MATELKAQSKCYQWFHNSFPEERQMLFRVKNELDNHPYKNKQDIFKQLSENKATGVIDGPSDFLYFLPNIVACIELKLPGKKQNAGQKTFEEKVVKRNHLYFVVEVTAEDIKPFQDLIRDLHKKHL